MTDTGDREGSVVAESEPPDADELERRLEALRGEIELPVPAASAVKVGGERAYKLHRQGVAVEMPLRRSRVDALELVSYRDGVARLDLRVSSGHLRPCDRDRARRALRDAAADRGRPVQRARRPTPSGCSRPRRRWRAL